MQRPYLATFHSHCPSGFTGGWIPNPTVRAESCFPNSESDCPSRFCRRIKTWNCRVTHRQTDNSFLALIFGLAVSDPTPNLSLSHSQISLSCARCLVLPGSLVRSLPGSCGISRAFTAWFFRDLSCARCLVSESDCPGRIPFFESNYPGRFRRRIKTRNYRVTHRQTNRRTT